MSLENGKMDRREFMKTASSVVGTTLIDVLPKVIVLEDTGEIIPTASSIETVFTTLLGDREHRQRRKESDEYGVYLWEEEFALEDGGSAEFAYMRKGRHKVGGGAISTKIYVYFFDTDGMPEGGDDLAEFVKGIWIKK